MAWPPNDQDIVALVFTFGIGFLKRHTFLGRRNRLDEFMEAYGPKAFNWFLVAIFAVVGYAYFLNFLRRYHFINPYG